MKDCHLQLIENYNCVLLIMESENLRKTKMCSRHRQMIILTYSDLYLSMKHVWYTEGTKGCSEKFEVLQPSVVTYMELLYRY